jgi:hypothetical protein
MPACMGKEHSALVAAAPARVLDLQFRRGGVLARRVGLRSEAEVGECALAVPVGDQPRHPAAADVEQDRSLLPICLTSTPLVLPRALK